MRSFLAAMAIACMAGTAGYAGYAEPECPTVALSDLAKVAEPAPFIPLPRPRAAQPSHPDLVTIARKYLGTNPTGWASVWCGRFMAMIAPDLAKLVPNPNLARSWEALPKVKTPVRGDIVVLRRGRGAIAGHVGVLSGFDRRGNPRVVSGNHNRKVAESVYPKSRVIAYVRGG